MDGAELEVMEEEEEENKREEADREEGEAWWRGWGGARMGRGFVKCERLEAHLNSGCVSPALAECYLLQHGNRGDGKGEGG